MADTRDLLQVVGERIGAVLGARTVFGDAVHAEGRTVIPVARVRFGFGAGSGGPKEKGGGGGGGGGVAVPAGVIEVTRESTRFIRFGLWKPLAAAAGAGFLAGWLIRGRR